MIVELTSDEIINAYYIGYNRSKSVNHSDTKISKNLHKNRPNWWRHFIGALGEVAYSKVTGEDVDTETLGKGDQGYDFKNGIDIKSSDLNRKPNLIISKQAFDSKICKTYLLAWVKLPYVELLGTIERDQVLNNLEKMFLKKTPYGETYIINNTKLKKYEVR